MIKLFLNGYYYDVCAPDDLDFDGFFITAEELEQREREAIYYAWDAHKHLRNPELEVSNEEIFQDYLEQQRKNHE